MIEDTLADAAERHRGYLTGLAYRLLGSVADAEDVVQDALLRYRQALADGVRPDSERAYLTTITTRLALNQLQSARVRREQYVGPWLPEPLVEEQHDPSDDLARTETASTAFLVLLERLTPEQRAGFVLHEVFGFPYQEIGSMIGKSAAACRQLCQRARAQLDAEWPRFPASRAQGDELARAFVAASRDGDVPRLVRLLLPDVEFVGDGGASGRGFPRVISGAEDVARLVIGVAARLAAADWGFDLVHVGGQPALRLGGPDGTLYGIWSLIIDGDRIRAVNGVVNPEKLGHLGQVVDAGSLSDRTTWQSGPG
ncbi:MAG TPA: RNA polymerase sigma factor SigJ [Microlunatus sp.]|nr:RNA polymerase sigma factor SigJ [Microlunatus sp.]